MKQDNQVTIYQTEDGKARIEVRFEKENVWLTQKQMAVDLFKGRLAVSLFIAFFRDWLLSISQLRK